MTTTLPPTALLLFIPPNGLEWTKVRWGGREGMKEGRAGCGDEAVEEGREGGLIFYLKVIRTQGHCPPCALS